MSRDMTINSMVHLPRLNGAAAVALSEQLLTAAAAEAGAEGLPLFIERPRLRMVSATLLLKSAILPKEEETADRVAADRDVDDGWRSYYEWSSSIARMRDGSVPEHGRFRSLHNTLFSDGLSFIVLPFREEWTQSEARLSTIEEGGYRPLIEQLGGQPFLTNIETAHERYGQVLGITAPIRVEETPELRQHLSTLIDAMKEYVFKVVAFAEPEEPGSEELSSALITPLLQWRSAPVPLRPQQTETEETSEGSASG